MESLVFLKDVLAAFYSLCRKRCVYVLNIIMGQSVNVRLCEVYD